MVFFLLGIAVDSVVDRLPTDFETNATFTPLISENEINPELQSKVNALLSCAGIQNAVHVSVVDDSSINAMALPGKHMVVNQGLLDAVKSDIGLSFVLAHELAHFQHKDHLRGLGRGIVLSGLSAMLTGSSSSLTQLLTPASHASQSHYSKGRETLADAAALKTVSCFYGYTEGATELFHVIASQPKQSHWSNLNHYLSSHPDTDERIHAINALTRELKDANE